MSDHVCIIPHPSPGVGSIEVLRNQRNVFVIHNAGSAQIGIRKHQLSRVTGPFTNDVLSSRQWFLVTQPRVT